MHKCLSAGLEAIFHAGFSSLTNVGAEEDRWEGYVKIPRILCRFKTRMHELRFLLESELEVIQSLKLDGCPEGQKSVKHSSSMPFRILGCFCPTLEYTTKMEMSRNEVGICFIVPFPVGTLVHIHLSNMFLDNESDILSFYYCEKWW
jgi:hypothetical protein